MTNYFAEYEFIGIDPKYELKAMIASIGDRIRRVSPSDSFVSFAIKKSKSAVEASCRIASKAGAFAAEVKEKDPLTAMKKIECEIGRQLNYWKRLRFKDEKILTTAVTTVSKLKGE